MPTFSSLYPPPLDAAATPVAIYHGTLPLILSGPARSNGPKGALDSATYTVLVDPGIADDQLTELGFAYDSKVTTIPNFHSMWVKDMKEEVESPRASMFTIELIGLLVPGEKRLRKILPSNATISNGKRDALVAGSADVPPEIKDYVTFQVVDVYFQETLPDYTVIGRAMTPPDPVDVPTIPRPGDPPTGYAIGWHLSVRVGEHTYGTLYRIEDTFAYGQYKIA